MGMEGLEENMRMPTPVKIRRGDGQFGLVYGRARGADNRRKAHPVSVDTY